LKQLNITAILNFVYLQNISNDSRHYAVIAPQKATNLKLEKQIEWISQQGLPDSGQGLILLNPKSRSGAILETRDW
jgi:hypothetical protein